MTYKMRSLVGALILGVGTLGSTAGSAQSISCPTTWSNLLLKLQNAVAAKGTLQMWGVVVNRNGVVCAVAHSGTGLLDQWLLSRQIAAAKAFTSNGLSTSPPGTKTADLNLAVQPGGGLFGLRRATRPTRRSCTRVRRTRGVRLRIPWLVRS
jgi:hypothetical protein